MVLYLGQETKTFLTIGGLTPGQNYTVLLSMYVSSNVKGDTLQNITFSNVSSHTVSYDAAVTTQDSNGIEDSSGQVYIADFVPTSDTISISGTYPYNRDRTWLAHYTIW